MNLLGFLKPGFWELIVIVLVILLLFGATKLPTIGKSLGEAIKGFKKSVKEEHPKPPSNQSPPPTQ